tara:strand:+ start:1761 stop:2219 length:459 start_codon:yes stop_codon:yes gene_type:complete
MLNKKSQKHMQRVITLSELNFKEGRIPIAAIIIDKDTNKTIAEAQNEDSPIGHAEIIVIKKALELLHTNRLDNTHMYVTIEPCPMCAYAIAKTQIGRLYFGCEDKKGGGVINGPRMLNFKNLKKIEFVSHCFNDKTTQLMQDFFKIKRNQQL